jgi:hypothetical protein
MKYSDRQRVQKIYDYAVQLQEYIRKNDIEKEELLTQLPILIRQLERCLTEYENTGDL